MSQASARRREVLGGSDEIGDASAPYGSPAWVRYLRQWTNSTKRDARSRIIDLRRSLESLKESDHWRMLADENGKPFPAWEAFCRHPEPWGLGMNAAQV